MATTTTTIRVGSKVKFNQGRGKFVGKVLSIDTETSIATVARDTDGKQFFRQLGVLTPANA